MGVPWRRGAIPAAFAICLLFDAALARAQWPNSDSVTAFDEMLAVRAGNPLLHGWVLATDNFLFTDLPATVLGSLVLGRDPRLVAIVAWAIFAFLLACAVRLLRHAVADGAAARRGALLFLLLAGVPWALRDDYLLWPCIHTGTIALALLAMLAAAPVWRDGRIGPARLASLAAITGAAAFSDPMADAILVLPLLLLVLARAACRGRIVPGEAAVAATATGAALGAALLLHLVVASGRSFSVHPNAHLAFVPDADAAWNNAHAMAGALRVLFTARAVRLPPIGIPPALALAIVATRTLAALGVAAAALRILVRLPRDGQGGVGQLLVLSAVVMLGLSTLSADVRVAIATGRDFPGPAVRFAVPPFLFLCLAAAIEGARRPIGPRGAAAMGFLAAPFAMGAAIAATRAAAGPAGLAATPDASVTAILRAEKLTHGVGDYWDARLVEALSAGRVLVDPVLSVNGSRLLLWDFVTDAARYRRDGRPQFAILRPGSVFRVDLAAVRRTYGPPAAVLPARDGWAVAVLRPAPP